MGSVLKHCMVTKYYDQDCSLVKILQSCRFNIFGIDASEKFPLTKIMNNRDCWNVYRFSCLNLHYSLLHYIMLHYVNVALFYVALLMLDYFDVALFDAAIFTVALLNVVLF